MQRLGIGLLGAFPPFDKGGRRRTTLGSSRQLKYGLYSWYGSGEMVKEARAVSTWEQKEEAKSKGPREHRKFLAELQARRVIYCFLASWTPSHGEQQWQWHGAEAYIHPLISPAHRPHSDHPERQAAIHTGKLGTYPSLRRVHPLKLRVIQSEVPQTTIGEARPAATT